MAGEIQKIEPLNLPELHNARLRGWQRITQNSNTTTVTTAAQWDWKRHALTVPLEAFVSFVAYCFQITFKHLCLKVILRKASSKHTSNTKSCEVGCQNLKRSRLSWPRLRVRDKESQITAMMQHFVKPNFEC